MISVPWHMVVMISASVISLIIYMFFQLHTDSADNGIFGPLFDLIEGGFYLAVFLIFNMFVWLVYFAALYFQGG